MPITVPTINPNRAKLADLRKQMVTLIAAAVTPATVRMHSEWKLKLDIGKVVSLLIPTTIPDTDKVHSWMIGTGSLMTLTRETGGFAFVGAKRAEREALFNIWGFIDYTIFDQQKEMSAQQIIEEEAELIADYFMANRNTLGFDVKPEGLQEVKPFQIENIDTHSFSGGLDLQIAECSVRIVLSR